MEKVIKNSLNVFRKTYFRQGKFIEDYSAFDGDVLDYRAALDGNGRSRIVGKPISQLLLKRGATVTICHSKTKDISLFTRQADILVAAVGRTHIITKDMIKPGAIVVDVGINRIDGKILGDVDTENALEVCDKITPVPGGVGLTTVLSLLENVVQAAKEQNNI